MDFCSKTNFISIALNCLSTPSRWYNCRKWWGQGNGNFSTISASISCCWRPLRPLVDGLQSSTSWNEFQCLDVHPVPHILAETLTFVTNPTWWGFPREVCLSWYIMGVRESGAVLVWIVEVRVNADFLSCRVGGNCCRAVLVMAVRVSSCDLINQARDGLNASKELLV